MYILFFVSMWLVIVNEVSLYLDLMGNIVFFMFCCGYSGKRLRVVLDMDVGVISGCYCWILRIYLIGVYSLLWRVIRLLNGVYLFVEGLKLMYWWCYVVMLFFVVWVSLCMVKNVVIGCDL